MFGKKGNAWVGIVAIVVVIIIIIWIVSAVTHKECKKDADCPQDSYCTSDFTCHKIPVIERTNITINREYNFLVPSLILGIAIVIAAFVYRKKEKAKAPAIDIKANDYAEIKRSVTEEPHAYTPKTPEKRYERFEHVGYADDGAGMLKKMMVAGVVVCIILVIMILIL